MGPAASLLALATLCLRLHTGSLAVDIDISITIGQTAVCPENCGEGESEEDYYIWERCRDILCLLDADRVIEATGQEDSRCMRSGKRLMFSETWLYKKFKRRYRFGNLIMSEGKLEQRITMNSCDPIYVTAYNNKVTVQIKCVFPLVVFNFRYQLSGKRTWGHVRYALSTKRAITLTVTLGRNNDGSCCLRGGYDALDANELSCLEVDSWYKPEVRPGLKQVENIANQRLSNGWLSKRFKREVEMFAFRVIQEAIDQKTRRIRTEGDILRNSCYSVRYIDPCPTECCPNEC